MEERYEIIYPEHRTVSRSCLVRWALDDIENGATDIQATEQELTADIALVVRILHDAGSVTVQSY